MSRLEDPSPTYFKQTADRRFGRHKYPFLLLVETASASASPDLRLGTHVKWLDKMSRVVCSKGAGLPEKGN